MFKEFREFLLKGSLIELAVAVIIATALTTVVKSLIDNIIMPVIAAFGGTPDFRDLDFTINDSVFRYGQFLNDVVVFVILGLVIFFVIVKPVNAFMEARARAKEGEPEPETTEELLADIRDLLKAQSTR